MSGANLVIAGLLSAALVVPPVKWFLLQRRSHKRPRDDQEDHGAHDAASNEGPSATTATALVGEDESHNVERPLKRRRIMSSQDLTAKRRPRSGSDDAPPPTGEEGALDTQRNDADRIAQQRRIVMEGLQEIEEYKQRLQAEAAEWVAAQRELALQQHKRPNSNAVVVPASATPLEARSRIPLPPSFNPTNDDEPKPTHPLAESLALPRPLLLLPSERGGTTSSHNGAAQHSEFLRQLNAVLATTASREGDDDSWKDEDYSISALDQSAMASLDASAIFPSSRSVIGRRGASKPKTSGGGAVDESMVSRSMRSMLFGSSSSTNHHNVDQSANLSVSAIDPLSISPSTTSSNEDGGVPPVVGGGSALALQVRQLQHCYRRTPPEDLSALTDEDQTFLQQLLFGFLPNVPIDAQLWGERLSRLHHIQDDLDPAPELDTSSKLSAEDWSKLCRSWRRFMERHPQLRSALLEEGSTESPLQGKQQSAAGSTLLRLGEEASKSEPQQQAQVYWHPRNRVAAATGSRAALNAAIPLPIPSFGNSMAASVSSSSSHGKGPLNPNAVRALQEQVGSFFEQRSERMNHAREEGRKSSEQKQRAEDGDGNEQQEDDDDRLEGDDELSSSRLLRRRSSSVDNTAARRLSLLEPVHAALRAAQAKAQEETRNAKDAALQEFKDALALARVRAPPPSLTSPPSSTTSSKEDNHHSVTADSSVSGAPPAATTVAPAAVSSVDSSTTTAASPAPAAVSFSFGNSAAPGAANPSVATSAGGFSFGASSSTTTVAPSAATAGGTGGTSAAPAATFSFGGSAGTAAPAAPSTSAAFSFGASAPTGVSAPTGSNPFSFKS